MVEAVYPDIKMRVQYGYDLVGRMKSLSYPGGEIVRYERDRIGRATAAVDTVAGRAEMANPFRGFLPTPVSGKAPTSGQVALD